MVILSHSHSEFMDDFHHWNLGCPNREKMWKWMTILDPLDLGTNKLWQAEVSSVSFPKNQVLCKRWCIYTPNEKAWKGMKRHEKAWKDPFSGEARSSWLDLVTRRHEALWTNRLQLSLLRGEPLQGRLHLGRIGRQGLGGPEVHWRLMEIDGDWRYCMIVIWYNLIVYRISL